jgi:hypothetical protein
MDRKVERGKFVHVNIFGARYRLRGEFEPFNGLNVSIAVAHIFGVNSFEKESQNEERKKAFDLWTIQTKFITRLQHILFH